MSGGDDVLSEMVLFGGIFAKMWAVPRAGTLIGQHAHESDHISMIVSGAVRVWCGPDLLGDFLAPAMVKIPARLKHKFLTLGDGVVICCLHALDTPDVPIFDENRPEEA